MKKKAIALLLLLAMLTAFLPGEGRQALAYSTGYPNTHINTGDQAEDIVGVALTQAGYTNDGTGTKYGAWYSKGAENVAWCAMFVSWCANQAEIPTSIIPKHSTCDTGMNWFKKKGLWQDSSFYGGSYTPQRGDIVYFSKDHIPTHSSHVGVVTGTSGKYLQVIEGNTTSDYKTYKVIHRTKSNNRLLADAYILGYGTPAYETFDVAELPAPPAKVKSGKTSYSSDEDVTMTWSAVKEADSYWAYLYKDGEEIWYGDVGSDTDVIFEPLSAGNYRLLVRSVNVFGFSDAAECRFSVVQAKTLSITAQPTDYRGKVGSTASFRVKASGSGLTYQWQLSDDAGKTWRGSKVKTAEYAVTLSETNNGRCVRCIVTDKNGASVTSKAARMEIVGPVITLQPAPVTAMKGDTVQFKVKASGSGLTYQWQLSDDKGKIWRNSSVKTADYATTLTEKNHTRYLRCIVTDKNGISVTSDAAYMKISSLAITSQPKSVTGAMGATVKLTVGASGPGLSYAWQLSDDQGKTWRASSTKSAVYTTTLTEKNNGRYLRCVVTDQYGNSVMSDAAKMRVTL